MQRHGKIALKRLIYCGYVQLKLSGTCSECIDRCVFTLYFDQSDRQLFSLLSSHREKQWCVLYDVFACALFAATKPQECYPLLGIFYREQRGDFLFLVSCNLIATLCVHSVRACVPLLSHNLHSASCGHVLHIIKRIYIIVVLFSREKIPTSCLVQQYQLHIVLELADAGDLSRMIKVSVLNCVILLCTCVHC